MPAEQPRIHSLIRVLLLDTDSDQAIGVIDVLEDAGYSVEHLTSRAVAVEWLRAGRAFDILLINDNLTFTTAREWVESVGPVYLRPDQVVLFTSLDSPAPTGFRCVGKPNWPEGELLFAVQQIASRLSRSTTELFAL